MFHLYSLRHRNLTSLFSLILMLAVSWLAPSAAHAQSAVTITSPANGSTVSGTVSIVTQISSSVSWENIYIDGKYFKSSPPLTFSWDSTTVANGSHTISANAYSSSGALLGSASVTVTVQNGAASATPTLTPTPAPTSSAAVTITSPANGSTVSGTVSIATQLSSSVSWENIYIDGKYFKSSPPLTFSWDSTTVANGSHTISANAYSSSGTLLGSASVTVNVQNVTATPTATIAPTPTATMTSVATPTATTVATVTATATIAPTATPTATPVATPTATVTATATIAPTATPTATTVATVTATATIAPTATPTATTVASVTPTPSATPTSTGAVTITSPTNGSTVSGTVSIVTQISSSVSWENVYIDGSYFKSSPPLTFSWDSTTVKNGSHTISANAYSSSGTVLGTASVTVNVQNGAATPTATATGAPTPTVTPSSSGSATPTPTPSAAVTITAPVSGSVVSGTVSIVAQVGSGVQWINVYIDGKYFKSSPPDTFSWDSTTVANGTHTISANAYNSSSTLIGTSSVKVDVRNNVATKTPIQHILVIVAENRSFDNLFATYTPPAGQTVKNLLSEGIVTTSGGAGPNYSLAVQQQATDQNTYSVTPTQNGAYSSLPQPNTTYANGLPQYVPDTRFPSTMPAGPYQITQSVAYNAFTGDPVHRFFQMWQQFDGGKMDLFAWVPLTAGLGPQSTPTPSPTPGNTFQGDLSMGYYNMAAGDAPHFQFMAQNYAIGDNYHQGLMGGTSAELFYVRAADVKYYNDGSGNPIVPPASLIENPNPQSGTNNFYTQDGDGGGTYVNCADTTQPGVAPIMNFLSSLSYAPFNGGNCAANHYYMVNNVVGTEPSSAGIPTIASALAAKNITTTTYGTGWGGVDISQLDTDIQSGNLAPVSFAKPDAPESGHPAFSTPAAFEDWVTNVMNELINNPTLFSTTAVVITFDESGGYYDSGYVEPIDFFGDGPRIPVIVISPYAKAGFVDHTYYDHASVLKFIEENWGLTALSSRSRDGLPNPIASSGNPYVPSNAPALGDIMNMFDFTNFRSNAPPIQ